MKRLSSATGGGEGIGATGPFGQRNNGSNRIVIRLPIEPDGSGTHRVQGAHSVVDDDIPLPFNLPAVAYKRPLAATRFGNDAFPNRQRPLRLGGRNWSSCPLPAVGAGTEQFPAQTPSHARLSGRVPVITRINLKL